MEDLIKETNYLLNKYHRSANKKLGQNFLINEEIVTEIVDSANLNQQDLVIEIGPGLGTLTKHLLEQAGKVVAIELDKDMVTILQDRFHFYSNAKIIHDDILKIDLNKLIQEERGELTSVKVVANLPYYITTPIIMKLLEDKLEIESITVMVQKEVAKRLTEKPGGKNVGAITYSVYYYAIPQEVLAVPRNCFLPAPEVDSEVIRLTLRKEKEVVPKSEELLFKVIKAAFLQRRKTLLNALINAGLIADKETGKKMLYLLGMEDTIRGERVSMQDYVKIADYLSSI